MQKFGPLNGVFFLGFTLWWVFDPAFSPDMLGFFFGKQTCPRLRKFPQKKFGGNFTPTT